ncbi:MAG: RsmB/NOP family class I SAM-dependent RNA methyltransferase [Sphingomicrobium sp.]
MPARMAALQMLDAVLRTGSTLESTTGRSAGLPPADRALALAIAGETLRRIPDLDDLIDSATRQRLPDDSKARMVLRLALAQKIGLDTPDHAVVATALPLVDGGPRRLVHGVLGTLLRRGIPALTSPRLPDPVEFRWRKAWGDEVVEAARAAIVRRPPLDLGFKSEAAAQAMIAAVGGSSLAPRHLRLDSQSVEGLPGFGDGAFWVQDLAASIPARLIGSASSAVLDLCAAPGGKTMQLAAAGHDVTALDISADRLERLRANLERTGLTARVVTADALTWKADRRFDAILLDAPCSATGTFRRHPEVLHRVRPQTIRDMAHLQARLLDRATGWLNPGGTIVYSVCSLEPEEGEEVVLAFLARNRGFRTAPPTPGELPDFAASGADGWLRLLPDVLAEQGGLDGFFIAQLVATD